MVWKKEHYRYSAAYRRLQDSIISKKEKKVICELVDKLLVESIKKGRTSMYYDNLRLMIERGWVKSYHRIDQTELYSVLARIDQEDTFCAYTKRDYKIALKRILEHIGKYDLAKKINTVVKPANLPRPYLTVTDVLAMLRSDWPYLRDKAAIACLYESGCRPHELFMLTKDMIRIEKTPAQFRSKNIMIEIAYLHISEDAKTGARVVPLIFSVPWLKAWLLQNNAPKYVWTKHRGRNIGQPVGYPETLQAIRKMAVRAGLERANEITLYWFRRGRITEISQRMTYSQHCTFAGWKQSSDMPDIYNQTSGINVLTPLLSPFGIRVNRSGEEKKAWVNILIEGERYLKSFILQDRIPNTSQGQPGKAVMATVQPYRSR